MADAHAFSRAELDALLSAIVGRTVSEADSAGVLLSSRAGRNKGRIGNVVEQSVLGYPPDSDQRPDLLVDGQPWELKCTGIVEARRGHGPWRAKEPMSVTAVSPEAIVGESFSTSAFWHKTKRLLVVYYLYVRPGRGVAVSYADFEFRAYDFHTWSELDRGRLEADWTVVRDYVRRAMADADALMPGLSTTVNPLLLYLDTSPKWPNRPRFRLKASLVTQMARERLDGGMRMLPDQPGLGSMSEVRRTLAGVAARCAGSTLGEMAGKLGIETTGRGGRPPKSLAEQVVVRLLTGHAGRASQVPLLAKAGMTLKTVTLTARGGRTEDMKLGGQLDFDELSDPAAAYEGSSFAAMIEDVTVVAAVLSEPRAGCELTECRLLGFKLLWLGSLSLDALALWDGMRERILGGTLADVPVLRADGTPRTAPKTGLPMTAPNWPKSRDGALFVRGTGSDATDKPVVVNGVRMYRQNLWAKGTVIARMVAEADFVS